MPIAFACPGCAKSFRVADELAGRRSKCPACGTSLTVPAGAEAFAAAPTPSAPPPTMAENNFENYGASGASKPRKKAGNLKWIAILGVVLLGGGTVLAVGGYFVFSLIFGPSGPGSDDMKYIPDGVQLLASFKPDEFIESSVGKEMAKALEVKDEKNLDNQLEESLGIGGKNITQIICARVEVSSKDADSDDKPSGRPDMPPGMPRMGGPSGDRVLIVHVNKKVEPDAKDMQKKIKRSLPWNLFGASAGFTMNGIPLQYLSPDAYTLFTGAADIAPSGLENAKTDDEKVENQTVYKKGEECFCIVDNKIIVYSDKFDTLKKILKRDKKVELTDSMKAAMKLADFGKTFAVAYDIKGVADEREATNKKVKEKASKGGKQFSDPSIATDKEETTEGYGISADFGSDIKLSGGIQCSDRASASNTVKFVDAIIAMRKAHPGGPKEPEKGKDDSEDFTKAKKKLYDARMDDQQAKMDVLDSLSVSSTFSKISGSAKIKGDSAVKAMKAKKSMQEAQNEVNNAYQKMGGGIVPPVFPKFPQ